MSSTEASISGTIESMAPQKVFNDAIRTFYRALSRAISEKDNELITRLLNARPVEKIEIHKALFQNKPLIIDAIRANQAEVLESLLSMSLQPTTFRLIQSWAANIASCPIFIAICENKLELFYILLNYYPVHQFLHIYNIIAQQIISTNSSLLHLSKFPDKNTEPLQMLLHYEYVCILQQEELYLYEKKKFSIILLKNIHPSYTLLKNRIRSQPYDQEYKSNSEEASWVHHLTQRPIHIYDPDFINSLTNKLDTIHQERTIENSIHIKRTQKNLKRLFPTRYDRDEQMYLIVRFTFIPQLDDNNAAILLMPLVNLISEYSNNHFERCIEYLLDKIGKNYLERPWESSRTLADWFLSLFKKNNQSRLIEILLKQMDPSFIPCLDLPGHFIEEWNKNSNNKVLDQLLIHCIPISNDNNLLSSGPLFFRTISKLHTKINTLHEQLQSTTVAVDEEPEIASEPLSGRDRFGRSSLSMEIRASSSEQSYGEAFLQDDDELLSVKPG